MTNRRRTFYTDQVIDTISAMMLDGAPLRDIARKIGTTPKRLSPRLCQLGIGAKRLKPVVVRVSPALLALLRERAIKRDVSLEQLVTRIVVRVVEDNLFAAILDDGA